MKTSTSLPILCTKQPAAAPPADAADRTRVLHAVLRVEAHLTDIQTALKDKLKDIGLAADLSSPSTSTPANTPATPPKSAAADPHLRLIHENHALTSRTRTLERELARTREEASAWRSLAQNVQAMQELAQAAFARASVLERENGELRQAVHAFAAGSASAPVQELQRIVAGLTEEVVGYKKREAEIKAKEGVLRGKENHSIIRAMRKQTRDLKRRSLQVKCAEGQDVTILAVNNGILRPADNNTELPAITSFQELFFL